MKAFTYKSATSEADAVKLLGKNAVPLAGGTSLLNLMKEDVLGPEVVVNLKAIRGLDLVEAAGDGLRIGANVTLAALLESQAVSKGYPALAQALESVATPQIRHLATLGGNLCAKTACWYYSHHNFQCPKKSAVPECPAKKGDHEQHAIFATDFACVSVHASSAAPALIALGAKVRIAGAAGAREIPLDEFFTMRPNEIARENVLAADEIVTHVILGKANPKSATYVVLPKESHDWPTGLASVALEMDGTTCRSARVCLGAVAPIPWRSKPAEEALAGKAVDAAAAVRAADAAVAAAKPLPGNAYKVQTARAAVRRAVLMAATGQWM
jgi:xanthine dehydrogenase YagS FAD-binding subunit